MEEMGFSAKTTRSRKGVHWGRKGLARGCTCQKRTDWWLVGLQGKEEMTVGGGGSGGRTVWVREK